MTVTFYKCTADKRRLNKLPFMSQVYSATIEADNNVDILSPDFTVAYNGNYVDHETNSAINYFKINELNRFYFVTDMVEMPATTLKIKGLCDVRMSFINGNDFEVSVIRNEYIKNSKITDKSLPINPKYHEPEIIPYDTDVFFNSPSAFHPYGLLQCYDILETQSGTASK